MQSQACTVTNSDEPGSTSQRWGFQKGVREGEGGTTCPVLSARCARSKVGVTPCGRRLKNLSHLHQPCGCAASALATLHFGMSFEIPLCITFAFFLSCFISVFSFLSSSSFLFLAFPVLSLYLFYHADDDGLELIK